MTSRLRKMFLLNAKTSGKACSGRITEIDPRGGAAITGPNGSGKTTTLQIIPLFFGYSPNQIAPAGENRESMMRFVLPYPECAIAFEYQRGDAAEDVCLVVLRRQSQSDAPEYRFINSPFQKEFFVANDPDTGCEIFLDDAGSVEACVKLQAPPSSKLTSAQYRSVILNTVSSGKDGDARRALTRKFSFSKKHLRHLDRLVAAVVKEHINFKDFTAVAATIVIDRMGSLSGSGGVKYPQLRQSKEQIERWLRDRDGAERALKLNPIIEVLRDLLGMNRAQELVLNQKKADAHRLRALNESIQRRDIQGLADLSLQKDVLVSAFNVENEQHSILVSTATMAEDAAETNLRKLKNRRQDLEENDAFGWAGKAKHFPALQMQASSKLELINKLQEQAQGIVQSYDLQVSEIKENTAKTAAKMKDGKEPSIKRYDDELQLLNEQERAAITAIVNAHAEQESTLQSDVDDLVQKVADANVQQQHPIVHPEHEERLTHARHVLQNHQDALIAAQGLLAIASGKLHGAAGSRNDLEQQAQTQKARIHVTEQALHAARKRAQPEDGSLHAALLSNGDDEWRQTLARVIDPALLSRTDLHAHFAEESGSLYGWALNLDVIAAPGWIQRDVLDKDLEDCRRDDDSARALLADLESRLAQAEGERQSAVISNDEAVAQLGVLQGKTDGFKTHLRACEELLVNARATAQLIAKQNHDRLVSLLATARTQLKRIRGDHGKEVQAEKDTFSDAKNQARVRRDNECSAIDSRVRQFESDQANLIRQTLTAKDRDLKNAGVDTDQLNALQKEHKSLVKEISEIAERSELVREWNSWISDQGPARYIDAKVVYDRALENVKTAKDSQETLGLKHKEKMRGIERQETVHKQSMRNTSGEIDILNDLDRMLADFIPVGASTLTEDYLAGDLKGACVSLLDQRLSLHRDIRVKLQRAERELCDAESSTKEFVVGVLNEVGHDNSELLRADRMVRLYDRIPREVIVNVNTSLSTILGNISEYRKTIQNFESEVKRFNNELQIGLQLVSRNFERFSDFTASVITDFDKIDFIGKLRLLDEVIQDHRAQHHATYSLNVPSASTAEALRAFMTALSSGALEIDLSEHITLSGSVTDDGNFKTFHSEVQLEQISSNGLTAIALISLLSGLLNVIRGKEIIHIPWATDEVGRFDGVNFQKLMQMLNNNYIDAVTASPALTPATYEYFAKRYVFKPHGVIAEYRPRARAQELNIPNLESHQ